MEFIELLISLGHQPLAWMCFFLGAAVLNLGWLAVETRTIIKQRRAAADEFRANIINRQIHLQRIQGEQAHQLRWKRVNDRIKAEAPVRLKDGELVWIELPSSFPLPSQLDR